MMNKGLNTIWKLGKLSLAKRLKKVCNIIFKNIDKNIKKNVLKYY